MDELGIANMNVGNGDMDALINMDGVVDMNGVRDGDINYDMAFSKWWKNIGLQ